MKYIAMAIAALWAFSLLITFSPLHYFANRPNYTYSFVILCVVLVGARILSQVKLKRHSASIEKSELLQIAASFFGLLLITLVLFIMVQLVVSGEFSLSANRGLFEERYSYFNYPFIIGIPLIILVAIAPTSRSHHRKIAIASWAMCIALLLFTGNRQFFFFSVIFFTSYRIVTARNNRGLLRKYVPIFSIVFAFTVAFSVLRLDYLGNSGGNVAAKYMASLTGAACTAGEYCETTAETVFQLVYAYLGLNHSGLAYSIDFFDQRGGLPAFSATFPMIHRRLDPSYGLHSYMPVMNYDAFVSSVTGGKFTNFFSTMFGAFAVEFGWFGVFVFSGFLLLITWEFSRRCTTSNCSHLDYCIFVLIITTYVFGIMQAPTTEPFFALIIIQWAVLSVLDRIMRN